MHANSKSHQKEIPALFFALRFCTHSPCHDCHAPILPGSGSLRDVQVTSPSLCCTIYPISHLNTSPAAMPLKRKAQISAELQIPCSNATLISRTLFTCLQRCTTMKELIFVNTSVQPESFCAIYLISTEQQIWLCGGAGSEQESAPAAHSSLSSLPKRSKKATATPGNPPVPPAKRVLSKESPKKEEQITKDLWSLGIWDSRGMDFSCVQALLSQTTWFSKFIPPARYHLSMQRDTKPQGTASPAQLDWGAREAPVPD